MFLDGAIERVRHVLGEPSAVRPRDGVKFVVVGNDGFAADYVAGDVDHRPAGVGVNAFAEDLGGFDDEAGLLLGLANRGVGRLPSRLDPASGELPGETPLLDLATDEQKAAVLDDHRGANDGLLGSGKYKAGIRATELRMKTDRGTCVAVGVTDATFELVRTFYVPFEDDVDEVTPVIARAVTLTTAAGRGLQATGLRQEIEAAPVDHLADIAHVMRDERRLRTQVVLARLTELNPTEYESWTFSDLSSVLSDHGVTVIKSGGVKVVRAVDIADAVLARDEGAD